MELKKEKIYSDQEPIGGCQGQGVGVGEMGEGGQEIQTSSYKRNKSWGSNVQHGDCS